MTNMPSSDNGNTTAPVHTPDVFAGSKFRGYKRLLIIVPLLTALVAGIVAFVIVSALPKQYRAEATLIFPSSGDSGAGSLISAINGLSQTGSIDSGGSVGLLGGLLSSPQVGNGPNTSIAVLSSLNCRTRVANICDLTDYWHTTMPNAVKRMNDIANFGIDKQGLLAIEVVDSNPVKAAQVTDAYLTVLKELDTELSLNPSRRNRIFIDARLKEFRTRVNAEEDLLANLQRKKTETLTESAAAPVLITSFSELEQQLNTATINLAAVDARIDWNNHVADLTAKSGTNLPTTVTFAQVPREQLRQLESQLAVATATLGPDNPQLKYLKIQTNAARRQTQLEIQREVNALQSGIAPETTALYATKLGLEAQKDGIENALTVVQSRLEQIPRSTMEEERLTTTIKTNATIVALLAEEDEKARLAEQRDATTFEVVDAATPPTEPFGPRRGYITAFAMVAGLLLGLAWLAARSVLSQRPPRAGQLGA